MPEPLLEHVKWNAVHGGVDPEPVAESLRTAMWSVRDPRFDHDAFDELPDAHAADWPDRHDSPLARSHGFAQPVGGIERVQVVWRDGDRAVDDLGGALGVLAFLETADRDRPAGQVDPGRRDLQQL